MLIQSFRTFEFLSIQEYNFVNIDGNYRLMMELVVDLRHYDFDIVVTRLCKP